jgi:hypothetical protein
MTMCRRSSADGRPIACRLHGDGMMLYCGAKVILERLALEKAGYTVQTQTFGPVGAALRFVNFTAHPSVTPGAPDEHSAEPR